MKRDFSTESKNRLFGLIDDINREQLCGFTDWIGDLSYTVKSWTGSLNINHYFNDVAAYQKKVLDKDNASRKSIQKIFSDVARVDNSYSNSYSKIISSLKHWDRYIVQILKRAKDAGGKSHGVNTANRLIKTFCAVFLRRQCYLSSRF